MNVRDAKSLRTAPLQTRSDLKPNAVRDISGALNDPVRRHVRALPEDQELPLAHERAALPRLSSDARRAGRPDLRHDRPDGRARAQDRRHDAALDRPHRAGCSACSTTTPTSSTPPDMLAELRDDNRQLAAHHARGPRRVRRASTTSPAPACSRSGSTRPSGAPGSCSRRRAGPIENEPPHGGDPFVRGYGSPCRLNMCILSSTSRRLAVRISSRCIQKWRSSGPFAGSVVCRLWRSDRHDFRPPRHSRFRTSDPARPPLSVIPRTP